MVGSRSFEEFVDEGRSVPTPGWDFSWFTGRATEERPPWGYSRLLAQRLGACRASLDVQTGGAEVYAEALRSAVRRPSIVAATEGWPPNVGVARRHLAHFGGTVIEVSEKAALPFPDATFDLVSSRHPILQQWGELARVLIPGGTYISQGIGSGTNRALSEAMMGPQPEPHVLQARMAAGGARAAGLEVVDLQEATTRVQFFDIAAVVYFLRKVIWTVPDFTVGRYYDQLLVLHHQIEAQGRFASYSQRYLVEARKPT